MFGRRSSTSTERADPALPIEASPRTRRRTASAEPPAQGRRLFERLQQNRQGTPRRTGAHEPDPQVTPGAPYHSSTDGARSRRGRRGRRLALGAGALTVLGGAFYLGRRRMVRDRDRRNVRR